MKTAIRYEFEGVTLDIPLRYDEKMGIYLEDYPDFAEKPVWTPEGFPVMFSGEDACEHAEEAVIEHAAVGEHAEEAVKDGCPDCGSCRFFRPAARHTWLGVCGHEMRRRAV